jgi:hypothetical protein
MSSPPNGLISTSSQQALPGMQAVSTATLNWDCGTVGQNSVACKR